MSPDIQRIAITFADGTVGVMSFVTAELDGAARARWTREATDEAISSEIARSSFGRPVASWRRMNESEIPTDRTFRNAWRDRGRIEVDMPAAREIHREHIRSARAPLLADLDIAYQRADEQGDQAEKRRVAQEKQRLRDLTDDPAIEAAQTPDELKAVWRLDG